MVAARTGGCYRFSLISDSTIVPALRPIVRSSKSVAAAASAPEGTAEFGVPPAPANRLLATMRENYRCGP